AAAVGSSAVLGIMVNLCLMLVIKKIIGIQINRNAQIRQPTDNIWLQSKSGIILVVITDALHPNAMLACDVSENRLTPANLVKDINNVALDFLQM
ncbi:MAG TPA: hypothetical protein VGM58_09065, partial [Verrucomicrobiae bacterium]